MPVVAADVSAPPSSASWCRCPCSCCCCRTGRDEPKAHQTDSDKLRRREPECRSVFFPPEDAERVLRCLLPSCACLARPDLPTAGRRSAAPTGRRRVPNAGPLPQSGRGNVQSCRQCVNDPPHDRLGRRSVPWWRRPSPSPKSIGWQARRSPGRPCRSRCGRGRLSRRLSRPNNRSVRLHLRVPRVGRCLLWTRVSTCPYATPGSG